MWADQTDNGAYFDAKSENHGSATLFENFRVMPFSWVKELDTEADLGLNVGKMEAVNWGYQVYGMNGKGILKSADIALHSRDGAKDDGVGSSRRSVPEDVLGRMPVSSRTTSILRPTWIWIPSNSLPVEDSSTSSTK